MRILRIFLITWLLVNLYALYLTTMDLYYETRKNEAIERINRHIYLKKVYECNDDWIKAKAYRDSAIECLVEIRVLEDKEDE